MKAALLLAAGLAAAQVIATGRLTGVNVATTITSPTSATTYDAGTASSVTVSGTAVSDRVIRSCTWTNSLGGSGTATGSTSWTIGGLALTVGSNVITVTCTNAEGTTAQDIITITRSGTASSNPIAAARLPGGDTTLPNQTWASAGVRGGIPSGGWGNCTTASCVTLCPDVTANNTPACTSGTVTTTSLTNALSSASGSSKVVWMPAGNFTGLTGIQWSWSQVALRGQGADQTKLTFSSAATGSCGWIQTAAFRICNTTSNIGCTTNCSGPGPDHSATWSAGYAQGTTTITVSASTGLVARSGATPGTTIYLDQLDPGSDSGGFLMCDAGSTAACSWEGNGGNPHRTSRSQVELHEVVSFSGTAPNVSVVIDPPVIAPNYASGSTPQAWWGDNHVKQAGIENLSADWTALGSGSDLVYLVNTSNCWMKGVRSVFNSTAVSFLFHVYPLNTFRFSMVDSYLYGPTVTASPNTNYAVSALVSGQNLYQNNILHHFVTGFAQDDAEAGSVYAYNYSDDEQYTPSAQPHGSGVMYTLWEGNNFDSIWHDVIHGPHQMETEFRNHLDRTAHNQGSVAENGGILIYAKNRYFNLIANVIGHSTLTTYANTTGANNAVYILNFPGSHGGTGPGTDSNVSATLFRACNWDSVTSSNDNGANDQTGTKNDAAEAPSGLSDYPNPAFSGSCTSDLPASFYLSAKPAWFQTIAYPPIGPDVSSSNIATATGGHANKNPARVCFESLGNDAAYGSSSPRIRTFNAMTCYGS